MTHKKRIVIAPDSFKESMTAQEVANAIEEGFSKIFPDWSYVKIPMADGGEGTVQSLVDATNGEMKEVPALDPLGNSSQAFYGLIDDGKRAIIEIAAASGLEKVEKSKRDLMTATSWGLGDVIRAALDEGVEEIIIGLGGSATNDGGAGMIQSLGGKLLDKDGEQIARGGQHLKDLAAIDLSDIHPRIPEVSFIGASDVSNPLTGPKGASFIYGPQKGASEPEVEELDENLKHFAEIIKKELELEVDAIPGAGAAGGTGGGLIAFLDAKLEKGGELIVELLDVEEQIREADLVITGEGGLNHQTIYGKTPIVIAQVAKKYDRPVIAIVGSMSADHEEVYEEGIDAAFSILANITDEETALADGYQNTVLAARNIAALLKMTL